VHQVFSVSAQFCRGHSRSGGLRAGTHADKHIHNVPEVVGAGAEDLAWQLDRGMHLEAGDRYPVERTALVCQREQLGQDGEVGLPVLKQGEHRFAAAQSQPLGIGQLLQRVQGDDPVVSHETCEGRGAGA
jgi:hypothetical protein